MDVRFIQLIHTMKSFSPTYTDPFEYQINV